MLKKIGYGEYYPSREFTYIDLSDIEGIGESAFASSSMERINGIVRNPGNFAFSV